MPLQDPLSLSLPRQQALAEVLAAVAAPLQPTAGGGGNSGAAINWAAGGILPDTSALGALPTASLASIPLLPLLHLVSGSPSPGMFTLCSHCRTVSQEGPSHTAASMDISSNLLPDSFTCSQMSVRRHEL